MENVINNLEDHIIELKNTYILLSKAMDKRMHESALDGGFSNAERYKIRRNCYENFISDLNYYLKLENNKDNGKHNN